MPKVVAAVAMAALAEVMAVTGTVVVMMMVMIVPATLAVIMALFGTARSAFGSERHNHRVICTKVSAATPLPVLFSAE